MTGVVAALLDAWTELRIHRARVLLSLFGVVVAVAALTASVALGQVVQQISTESMIQQTGQPATIQFTLSARGDEPVDGDEVRAAFEAAAERYQMTHASPSIWTNTTMQTPAGAVDTEVIGVGVPYAEMHRITIEAGRWFADDDARRLAPVAVANQAFLDAAGAGSLAERPTVRLGEDAVGVTVVGLAQTGSRDFPRVLLLYDEAAQLVPQDQAIYLAPQLEVWVPTELADQALTMVRRDLMRDFPEAIVDANRVDYLAFYEEIGDPAAIMQAILVGISSVVLLLGALSLVNIAVVTVRQRVREIGIRRAFGAGRGRIFVTVMLESVVATVVAGIIGIALIVFVYRLPFLPDLIGVSSFLSELPPFPIAAAITGLVVSTIVGALAGAIPATIAVRSKVIDAIRF